MDAGETDVIGTLTIGRLASAAGVNVETVRYYERRGLLDEPPRTLAGYRQYDASHVARLRFVGRAKRLGFTLAEIHDLVAGTVPMEPTAPRQPTAAAGASDAVLTAARAKLLSVDQQLRELRETRARLEQLVALCADGSTGDCAMLNLAG